MYAWDAKERTVEKQYDPTQDDEGFAHYFGFNKQYDE